MEENEKFEIPLREFQEMIRDFRMGGIAGEGHSRFPRFLFGNRGAKQYLEMYFNQNFDIYLNYRNGEKNPFPYVSINNDEERFEEKPKVNLDSKIDLNLLDEEIFFYPKSGHDSEVYLVEAYLRWKNKK